MNKVLIKTINKTKVEPGKNDVNSSVIVIVVSFTAAVFYQNKLQPADK